MAGDPPAGLPQRGPIAALAGDPPTGLPQRGPIAALAGATFLQSAAGLAIVPILPLYLHSRGVSYSFVGAVIATYFVGALLAQYPAGYAADRYGRRPVMLAGLLAFGFGAATLLVHMPVPLLGTLRALQGAGYGAFSVAASAHMASLAPPHLRGRAYSVLSGSFIAGVAAGPMFGGMVGVRSVTVVFLVAAAGSVAAALLSLLATGRSNVHPASTPTAGAPVRRATITDRDPATDARAPTNVHGNVGPTTPTVPTTPTLSTVSTVPATPTVPTGPTVPNVPTVPTVPTGPTVPTVPTTPTVPNMPNMPTGPNTDRRRQAILGAAVFWGCIGLLSGAYEVAWSPLLVSRAAHGWQIGLSWAAFGLPFMALSWPAGRLADRGNRRVLATGSAIAQGLFAVAYPLVPGVDTLVGMAALEAVVAAFGPPATQSMLSTSCDPDQLGRAQGLVLAAQTGAQAAMSFAAGALYADGHWIPFVAAGLVAVAAALTIPIFWRNVPPSAHLTNPPLAMPQAL